MIPIAKPYLEVSDAQNAYDTILTGWITQGPKVKEFEEKFSEYTGAKYSVAVSNCTTALHLAMIVAGIKEGDEVICPSMSYIATANCIKYMNAFPIFAEVNEQYNLDVEDVKKKITSKTKAILIVHQIGMPADIDAFRSLCNEKGLILIEDAACAAGSSYKGNKIGLRRVDFWVANTISLEIKAKSEIDSAHLAQAINYIEAMHTKGKVAIVW